MKLYIKNKVSGHSGGDISQEIESIDDKDVTDNLNDSHPETAVGLTQPTQRTGFLSWTTYPKLIRESLALIRWIILIKGPQWLYLLVGIRFLNKAQTVDFLQSCQLIVHPPNSLLLPEVIDLENPTKQYFPQTPAIAESAHVWSYHAGNANATLLPYGGVLVNNKVLCTDTDHYDFYRNLRRRQKRTPLQTKTLIAPWSHYLDGFTWGGYYDYLVLLVGKLCRMKDVLPESVFNEALVAYPLFNTPYEREYLSLLGITPNRVINSLTHQIAFEHCILGDIGHWFYPNSADIASIRKHILNKLPPTGPFEGNRIYISRAGRRCIRNENELINLLLSYDFQIIEDKPRSVAEQVAIYRNAKFILGPHGASFSNIIWSPAGTHLFELFSATYIPEHFRYLAELLGLGYSAYHLGPVAVKNKDWAKGLEDSVYVDITVLKRCLDKLLTI